MVISPISNPDRLRTPAVTSPCALPTPPVLSPCRPIIEFPHPQNIPNLAVHFFPHPQNIFNLEVHFGDLGIDQPAIERNHQGSISPAPLLGPPASQLPRIYAVSQMPNTGPASSVGFDELCKALKHWECPDFKNQSH